MRGAFCSRCSMNGTVYFLIVLLVALAWFPVLTHLSQSFAGLQIVVDFVQFLGICECLARPSHTNASSPPHAARRALGCFMRFSHAHTPLPCLTHVNS